MLSSVYVIFTGFIESRLKLPPLFYLGLAPSPDLRLEGDSKHAPDVLRSQHYAARRSALPVRQEIRSRQPTQVSYTSVDD